MMVTIVVGAWAGALPNEHAISSSTSRTVWTRKARGCYVLSRGRLSVNWYGQEKENLRDSPKEQAISGKQALTDGCTPGIASLGLETAKSKGVVMVILPAT
ncbi:hypothetical protein F441_11457 [Phytophthora nicotianae CJ01A1]|uniref:Uncharacterized protein n=3 Tax=Phytophthora nicotianae TaxID=4792 RepID=V9EYF4_PHYNI|nr:hypothetical protein F443_11537 [Phytophthora nicotianae P1569]ETO72256.1 hypothetical protein F444_11608 [Phytophthora nicotianae P1976]ETP13407.1 hypothetical protein F441_11457 [Phytophthora nicotianae CJ01A1]